MAAQPGGRQPAPAHLRPLQDLLNTVNLESGEDALSAEGFGAWAAARGGGDAAEADRVRLQSLREDLRAWVADHAATVPEAVAEAVAAADLRIGVVEGRLGTTSPTAFGRLVGPVVEGIALAQRDDDWRRLKVCDRGTCRWAFYDHSRNNASRWCASSICGAREKSMRAYRKRVGQAPEPSRPS